MAKILTSIALILTTISNVTRVLLSFRNILSTSWIVNYKRKLILKKNR